MNDYYKRRQEEAPFNAMVVLVCMILAFVMVVVAWLVK